MPNMAFDTDNITNLENKQRNYMCTYVLTVHSNILIIYYTVICGSARAV